MSLQLLLRCVAWLLLVGLVVVTIGPIGWRPISPLPTQVERALALLVIGLAFGLAYPRHLLLVGLLLVGATALLELTQVFEPSRHGRWLDLGVKVVGGVVGLAIGAMLARLKPAAR